MEDQPEKKPYEAPIVQEVDLVREGMTFAACKFLGIAGPGRPSGWGCVHPAKGPCSDLKAS